VNLWPVLEREPGGLLKGRLQESYHLYLEIVTEMQRVMVDLTNELTVGPNVSYENLASQLDSGAASAPSPTTGEPTTTSSRKLKSSFSITRFARHIKRPTRLRQHTKMRFKQHFSAGRREYYWHRAKFAFGENKRKRLFEEF